jgi:hypothetical protein
MPLTTNNPGRFTNTREVLLAVHRQLVSNLADIFPEETIVLADPDDWDGGLIPEQLINSTFLVVCLTDSEFPDDVQVGGGANTCEELGGIQVHIFSDSRLSQLGHTGGILEENEGLLELKRRVLRALVGTDPTGDNAYNLLSQLIPIRRATKPRLNPQGIRFLTLDFGISYFWDLT